EPRCSRDETTIRCFIGANFCRGQPTAVARTGGSLAHWRWRHYFIHQRDIIIDHYHERVIDWNNRAAHSCHWLIERTNRDRWTIYCWSVFPNTDPNLRQR